jgi:hypothetical protein
VLVRLSLLEAMFLAHGLECLTLHEEARRCAVRVPRLRVLCCERVAAALAARTHTLTRVCACTLWSCARAGGAASARRRQRRRGGDNAGSWRGRRRVAVSLGAPPAGARPGRLARRRGRAAAALPRAHPLTTATRTRIRIRFHVRRRRASRRHPRPQRHRALRARRRSRKHTTASASCRAHSDAACAVGGGGLVVVRRGAAGVCRVIRRLPLLPRPRLAAALRAAVRR